MANRLPILLWPKLFSGFTCIPDLEGKLGEDYGDGSFMGDGAGGGVGCGIEGNNDDASVGSGTGTGTFNSGYSGDGFSHSRV